MAKKKKNPNLVPIVPPSTEGYTNLTPAIYTNTDDESSSLSDELTAKLLKQVTKEFKLCYDFINPKWKKWELNLKLYNNQRRDSEAVGDPLLFTVFQTILASLYDDTMSVMFKPREEGDIDSASNLNDLAAFDYDEMEKATIDYEWDWDTGFFGNGLLFFNEFYRNKDKDKMVPMPEVADPLIFLRDPDAVSFNGDMKGRGGARMFGRYQYLTKNQMPTDAGYFDIDKVQVAVNINSQQYQASQARAEANNLSRPPLYGSDADLGDNCQYEVWQWFTHFNGKKVIATIANNGTLLIRYQTMDVDKPWPCINRQLYPAAHTWDGVSIPDLVEDKQRARAVTQNLSLKVLKAQLNPKYIYDKTKIHDPRLLDFNFQQAVGVDGNPNGVAMPMQKDSPNLSLVQFIMDTLDNNSQRATATPEVQQGVVSNEKRTLGEIELTAQKSDTRYSLSAKLFGNSERQFWERWYQIYKEHFAKEIDKKIIRIDGAFGTEWKGLTRENIVSRVDPDVAVTSKSVSMAEQQVDRALFMQFLQIAIMDPATNKRYGLKKAATMFGLKSDEIGRLMPPTPDEMQAEDENELLNDDKSVQVQATDNHTVHLEMHSKAKQTPKMLAHVHTHKVARMLQATRPDLFPNLDQQAALTGQAPQPQGGGQPVPAQGQAVAPAVNTAARPPQPPTPIQAQGGTSFGTATAPVTNGQ